MDITKWNQKEKDIKEKYSKLLSELFEKKDKEINQFFGFDSGREPDHFNPKDQLMNKHYDFIFSGCSETHGDWISPPTVKDGSVSKIWGFQVADKLNFDKPLNLAMGGFSAHAIIKDLISYCIKNGNPKTILILFPDFGRFPHVVNQKITAKNLSNNHDYIQHFYLSPAEEYDFPPLSKAPHEATEVLSYKQSVYINLQSIIMFEQYCKSNNIYIKYSSWDYLANTILKKCKSVYPNLYSGYTPLDFTNWHNWDVRHHPNLDNCHLELKNIYPKIFNFGGDGRHMGIHRHTHIAEGFVEEYEYDHKN